MQEVTTAKRVGFRLLESTVIPLTRELVEQYHGMERSPTERDVNPSRVKHLREKADAGQLVTFHWVRAKLADKLIRVNGQHSSKMLFELDGMMPSNLQVLQETYECDTGDDLALLHQQFDDRKSARSSPDIAGVYQGLQADLFGIDKTIAKLAIDGYTWHQRYVEKVPTVLGDLSYSLFGDTNLHPFIKWLGELHNSKTRELQKRPVTAAIFATYTANETACKEFWEHVSRGGDPDQEDLPQTALDAWLRGLYEGSIEVEKFGAGNYYQGCIYAWNANREDKRISQIRYDVKKNFASARE